MFERFYLGRTAAKAVRGTGLGLYIVRTLARAMGGDATLHSRPGKGVRVAVSFRWVTREEVGAVPPDHTIGTQRPTPTEPHLPR